MIPWTTLPLHSKIKVLYLIVKIVILRRLA